MQTNELVNETVDAPTSRRSRTVDQRSADTRVSNQRPTRTYRGQSKFDLPEKLANHPDFQFAHIPYAVANEETTLSYDRALDAGYKAVKTSEYPELARVYEDDPFTNINRSNDIIKVGNQVLMKRPIEFKEDDEAYYREQDMLSTNMVNLHKSNVDPASGSPFLMGRERNVGRLRI